MGGTTKKYSQNSPQTDAFQNTLYSSIYGLKPPAVSNPNYAATTSFTPSSTTRTGGVPPAQVPSYVYPSAPVNNNPGVTQFTGAPVNLNADGSPSTPGAPIYGTPGDAYHYDTGGAMVNYPSSPSGRAMQDWMTQMFAGMPTSTPGAAVANLPGLDVANAGAASMGAATAGGGNQIQSIIDMITHLAGGAANTTGASLFGGPIAAPMISSAGTGTQSADQITQGVMGGDSMFTRNILPAYNNLFNTQNQLTAAAAKESAGNLTGTGFANPLATALNRNNSSQQALLAQTLQNLTSQEIQRQGAGAALANTRNIAQGQMGLEANTSSAQLRQSAEALALQARQSGRSDLMQAAQVLSQRAEAQAAREQEANRTNAGFTQESNIYNAGATNTANTNYFNAGVDRNKTQAQLDADRQKMIYQTSTQTGQFNAAQMGQILQMLFAGGKPQDVQTQSGAGAAVPGIMAALPAILKALAAMG